MGAVCLGRLFPPSPQSKLSLHVEYFQGYWLVTRTVVLALGDGRSLGFTKGTYCTYLLYLPTNRPTCMGQSGDTNKKDNRL